MDVVGVLWRLNELGWLPKLTRVASVSGGSITAGVLALNWGVGAANDAAGASAQNPGGYAPGMWLFCSAWFIEFTICCATPMPSPNSTRRSIDAKLSLFM